MKNKFFVILFLCLILTDLMNGQFDDVDNEEIEQVQMQTTDDSYDYEEPVQQHEQQLETFARLKSFASPDSFSISGNTSTNFESVAVNPEIMKDDLHHHDFEDRNRNIQP